VQSVMVYGSQTWPIRVEEKQHLKRAERMMVRWMCSVTLKNRPSEELKHHLNIESLSDVERRGRLRWFGYEERKYNDVWVKKCQKLEAKGKALRGRERKTWFECVRGDIKDLEFKSERYQRKGRLKDWNFWSNV